MKLSLLCPSCSRPIADLPSGTSQVTCAACHHQYGIVYGKLSRRSSLRETLLFFATRLPSIYKRHYTLQITTPDRSLRRLQFSIPGKADTLPVHYGDIVSVLYTVQGYVMKKLVAITNHTTGKRYVLPNPIPSAAYQTTILAAATTGLLITSFIGGWNLFLVAAISALSILFYLKLAHTAQLTSPPLEECGGDGKRLVSDQRLLVQKLKIEQRIEELSHDCKATQQLIEQLEALKRKMQEVDPAMYSARIYRTTTAVNILKQQIANNHRLVREYRRTLKMIEIEVDTSWIADQLPDADHFNNRIVERLEELKEIEDQNQFLKFQLAAYEEVKNYGVERFG